jgi:hypothetical protein
MEDAMKRWFNLLLIGLVCLLAAPQIGVAGGGADHQVRQPRPIELGTSGGNVNDRSQQFCCSGTLGALVDKGGTLEILSNNHVLAIINSGTIGDDINQPGNIDVGCQIIPNDVVADLSQFEPISFTSDNTIDAATAEIRSGQVKTDGSILKIGPPSSTPVAASVGMKVKKSGRTTGLTRGIVRGINVTVNVRYPEECGSNQVQEARFVNQFRVRARPCFRFRGRTFGRRFSKGGDSGSLIVEDVDVCPRPVGLLFAGGGCDTIANPISDVLSTFNASIVGCVSAAAEEQPLTEGSEMNEPQIAAAIAVQERHTDALMRLPGVVGTGIGQSEETGQVVIEVYVEQATTELKRAIPQRLEGIPVKTVVTGKITAQYCPESPVSQETVLRGGLQVQ